MDNEKVELQLKQIADSINATTAKYNEALEAKADSATLNAFKEQLATSEKQLNSLNDVIVKQGEHLAKIESNTSKPVDFTSAFAKALKENKAGLDAWKESKSGTFMMDVAFDTKAGATIDAAQINTGLDFATMVPGIGQIPIRQTFMKGIFPNRTVGTEFIKYADQDTVIRDAQNTIRCAPITTTTSISWIVRNIQIKKVKDYINVCLDMMDDYDYVEGEVRSLIDTSVQLKTDEGLLLGDGTGNFLNGVDASAATFNAATVGADYSVSVKLANLYDLICVAGAQISAAGQENKWFANVVILNPRDAKLLKLDKDIDGNYLRPDFANGLVNSIDGIAIIENPLVPAGQAYVMDSRQGTVYQNKGVTLEFAFENRDNFENELVTVKAYERLNLLIRNVDANAFIHIPVISTAITAITAP